MNIESLRDYVLEKPSVTEGFPFGETVLVFKVNGKVFLLVPLDTDGLQFNAKCDPDRAVSLREEYPDVIMPGYHMNKQHWNTVRVNGTLPNRLVQQLIDDSYELVSRGNKKRK